MNGPAPRPMYSASEVRVKVGDGTEVQFAEETHYPFEDAGQDAGNDESEHDPQGPDTDGGGP